MFATNKPAAPSRPSESVGPYILGKTLGEGSSGKVKLGTHRETGQKVAIKILKKEALTQAPSLRRKVEREIAVMKLMDHPHVLRLYDVLQTSRYLFLILEHVEGGELFDYLVKQGRLDPQEAFHFFQQIIGGIEYCHKRLICHRDLKPENLLLDLNKNIKIADFGMASMMKEGKETPLETSCGSPHYASPEVVRGDKYTGMEADVWSCGVILFALVAGRLPFDDENLTRLLQKVKAARYHMPEFLPDDVKDLIRRMLAPNPRERISIAEIKRHPWWLANCTTPLGGIIPVDSDDLDEELISREIGHVDDDIFRTIQSLGWRDPDYLRAALTSHERTLEKVIYNILLKRKGRQPPSAARQPPAQPQPQPAQPSPPPTPTQPPVEGSRPPLHPAGGDKEPLDWNFERGVHQGDASTDAATATTPSTPPPSTATSATTTTQQDDESAIPTVPEPAGLEPPAAHSVGIAVPKRSGSKTGLNEAEDAFNGAMSSAGRPLHPRRPSLDDEPALGGASPRTSRHGSLLQADSPPPPMISKQGSTSKILAEATSGLTLAEPPIRPRASSNAIPIYAPRLSTDQTAVPPGASPPSTSRLMSLFQKHDSEPTVTDQQQPTTGGSGSPRMEPQSPDDSAQMDDHHGGGGGEKKPWWSTLMHRKKTVNEPAAIKSAFGIHSSKNLPAIWQELERAFKSLNIEWRLVGDSLLKAKQVAAHIVEFEIEIVQVPETESFLINFVRVSGDPLASRVLFDKLQSELRLAD